MTKLRGLIGILECFNGSPPKSMVITVVSGVVFLGGFFSKITRECLGICHIKNQTMSITMFRCAGILILMKMWSSSNYVHYSSKSMGSVQFLTFLKENWLHLFDQNIVL